MPRGAPTGYYTRSAYVTDWNKVMIYQATSKFYNFLTCYYFYILVLEIVFCFMSAMDVLGSLDVIHGNLSLIFIPG